MSASTEKPEQKLFCTQRPRADALHLWSWWALGSALSIFLKIFKNWCVREVKTISLDIKENCYKCYIVPYVELLKHSAEVLFGKFWSGLPEDFSVSLSALSVPEPHTGSVLMTRSASHQYSLLTFPYQNSYSNMLHLCISIIILTLMARDREERRGGGEGTSVCHTTQPAKLTSEIFSHSQPLYGILPYTLLTVLA